MEKFEKDEDMVSITQVLLAALAVIVLLSVWNLTI